MEANLGLCSIDCMVQAHCADEYCKMYRCIPKSAVRCMSLYIFGLNILTSIDVLHFRQLTCTVYMYVCS